MKLPNLPPSRVFISHSSEDDALVRELRMALADHGQDIWIDSRELRGGDPLWTEIQKALDGSSAFAVVVSPNGLQSEWVGKELRHAIKLREERGPDMFPVIPLSLNGTQLGVLKEFFDDESIYTPISSGAGGVEAAINAILVALGKRLPAEIAATPQPQAEPLEELVLELTDIRFDGKDAKRRASARARLVYEPATPGQPPVHSERPWRLIAPLGPIEAEELTWYLEKYATWPSDYFKHRARKVETDLQTWGRLLHDAVLPVAHTGNVVKAWARIGERAGRRFSMQVDTALEAGASDAEVRLAQEAATELLKVPWELLHDGESYLFQGARPTRVRRRLPGTRMLDVPVVAPPIRILLLTARPEDDSCGYIDHRVSSLPLVQAMESLPGLVQIHLLSPPTLPALGAELERARALGKPYHVVHFDGHGVYDHTVGLGGLCFEHPEDIGKLERRRHLTVFTSDLGPLLRDHRIPLVFLEACQTALSEKASESVASELLKVGVASVVAMSHSVLVETARRFVETFYQALAAGKRVGDAMLAGQRLLKEDTRRGRGLGAGDLRLEDWFVPVLFQEKDDPQLFTSTPAEQTLKDFQIALTARLGELPPEPQTGFVGRSRELLALQRLLKDESYAVVRGQGGEGKTALASEFARWMVRSQQIRRAAFVSVEMHSNVGAVLDALGRQLVRKDYSVATFEELEKAILPVERALAEQATLLVVDNMESILLPLFVERSEALSEDARRELEAILKLCARLNANAKILFTSREALPAPFNADRNRRELHQLHPEDAVKLVERVLNTTGEGGGASTDAAREEIEQLVEAVHCHARTLALLAPSLRERGVQKTRESLVALMVEMEQRFPGSREKSVFASVELSLRRLSYANRERARVLGVFHGGVNLFVLATMMQWNKVDLGSLAGELIQTGLATQNPYNHLTLNHALCRYLRGQMTEAEHGHLTVRWAMAMWDYVEFLSREQNKRTEIAATLTLLELPNLFALLDLMQGAENPEATIYLATALYNPVRVLGKPRLLERVGQVRDAAAVALEKRGDNWSHARFEATRTRLEEALDHGRLREAFEGAQQLLLRARTVGERAYIHADYDTAMACFLMARVIKTAGAPEKALPLLDEARKRFETLAKKSPDGGTERMVSACFSEQGESLLELGRLGEAADAYLEGIRRDSECGDERDVAIGKVQLGTIRLQQRRYSEALAAISEAREWFTKMNEPGGVSGCWHQTGVLYEQTGQPKAAEDAYHKSLALKVRLEDKVGQASTLNQLATLCVNALNRPEEAVAFYRQAAEKYVEMRDATGEGRVRNNLAHCLHKLGRVDEARAEILRAIECKAQFGYASTPWTAWDILAAIEESSENSKAALEARGKALASFLAYRRDGGENHTAPGLLASSVTQFVLEGNTVAADSLLHQFATNPEFSHLLSFIRALQAVVAGRRDPALANTAKWPYTMAAEILILIERLGKTRGVDSN